MLLSPETSTFCLEIARAAKKYGTKISFDLNYRASFWKGREQELSDSFTEIASFSDILIGNEEDFQLCLGIKGPEAGGEGLEEKIESFKEMIKRVKKNSKCISFCYNTYVKSVSANEHLWGAIMLEGEKWHVVKPREINVLIELVVVMDLLADCFMVFLKVGIQKNGFNLAGQQELWQQLF